LPLALGEARAVQPHEAIPNLETGVLQCHHETMMGAGATEGKQVVSGLEDTEHGRCHLTTGRHDIPLLPHEAEAVGRVSHHGIHRIRLHLSHGFKAIAKNECHLGVYPISKRRFLASLRATRLASRSVVSRVASINAC